MTLGCECPAPLLADYRAACPVAPRLHGQGKHLGRGRHNHITTLGWHAHADDAICPLAPTSFTPATSFSGSLPFIYESKPSLQLNPVLSPHTLCEYQPLQSKNTTLAFRVLEPFLKMGAASAILIVLITVLCKPRRLAGFSAQTTDKLGSPTAGCLGRCRLRSR